MKVDFGPTQLAKTRQVSDANLTFMPFPFQFEEGIVQPSAFFNISLTTPGLALPCIAFIV